MTLESAVSLEENRGHVLAHLLAHLLVKITLDKSFKASSVSSPLKYIVINKNSYACLHGTAARVK